MNFRVLPHRSCCHIGDRAWDNKPLKQIFAVIWNCKSFAAWPDRHGIHNIAIHYKNKLRPQGIIAGANPKSQTSRENFK
jgi:hypothetical protein